jgi:dTDP-4-amino-4,6-dideoxygalactose transaminase
VKATEGGMKVPILDLKAQYKEIRDDISKALDRVLESQRFILGGEVESLEAAIAQRLRVKHAVGVASGTDALLLSLKAAGVGHGDEVITTPFTFFATAGAIWNLGAKPVFVDIAPATFNLNPELVRAKVTPKTKAAITVHLFGQCANIEPLLDLSEDRKALGGDARRRYDGARGNAVVLSFEEPGSIRRRGDGVDPGRRNRGQNQTAEGPRKQA